MEALTYLRDRTIPSFDSPEGEDPYALIIVVNDNKGQQLKESDVYHASAEALLLLLADESDEVRKAIKKFAQ